MYFCLVSFLSTFYFEFPT